MKIVKTLLLLAMGLHLSCTSVATQSPVEPRYAVHIDLTQVKDDKIPVTLQAPAIKQGEIIYNMPKIVPGTYSVSDFGKYVSDFQALDKQGNPLPVARLDTNRWRISQSQNLDRITYWVDDTFDAAKREDVLFEPGGTNIEEGKNFLINTFGFVGYFDGLKQVPYELTITKPNGFYGSTPLQAVSTTATADTYLVPSYVELADSPLMYNQPDTTVLHLGDTKVLVSVYSPTGRVTSKPIADNIKDILEAQRSYLGGNLPVDKYAFLIYVPQRPGKSGSYGALEHANSSVYYLPEMPEERFNSTMRDVAAHEFFHIVTPLSIQSEEIHDFDFINPRMSKHLWLYEGVTEYFASHVQVYEGLIPIEEFMTKLREYIYTSRDYYNDTLAFTEMSAKVLEEHEKEYGNVYQKGALIGMALDIQLRDLSGGQSGLRDLMQDLAKTYGKGRPFKDDELFDKITELTYPEIRTFFARHVEGSQPLPLKELFSKVGIRYEPVSVQLVNSYGGFVPGYDREADKITVAEADEMDDFGKQMGFREGDQLLAFNGKEITPLNIREIIGEELQQARPGSKIEITVGRKDSKGVVKPKKLTGKVTQLKREVLHMLEPMEQPSEQQLKLRAAWLNESMP
ncbi:peptidase M61 [Pontibacter sp. JH31]|uniref:Peptidase M61 n=1 Tax=Pontibacter aquaedesilientis TaxID=2766980 RepID=A0ABR7XFJ7_9BACT|nr:peptidase M61 [Pontibacter aquaedesilientis]MBD1397052.1 peptidase M61 [Pontibacter aquaedesilientis]